MEGLNSWPTSRAFMEVMGMLKFFAGVDAASTLGVTLEDQSLMIPYLKGFNSGLGKGMGLDG